MYVFFLSLHIQITSILSIQFYTSELKLWWCLCWLMKLKCGVLFCCMAVNFPLCTAVTQHVYTEEFAY